MSTRFEQGFDPILDTTPGDAGDRDAKPEVRGEIEGCACGLVPDIPGDVLNEEAFHYFLELERKRSAVSNRPLVLLLVDLGGQSPEPVAMDGPSAEKLFAALLLCLRETDFIGWYRTRFITGAVLTHCSDTAGADLQEAVSRRLEAFLRQRVPSNVANLIRVRMHQLPAAGQGVA